ncbi:MAG: hypothetical protein SGPRY_006867 [Prymnesium sp.]
MQDVLLLLAWLPLARAEGCSAQIAPLLSLAESPSATEEDALSSITPLLPQLSLTPTPSAAELIANRQPTLLKGTTVDIWPASSWSWRMLSSVLANESLAGVASLHGHLYAPVDKRAALDPLLRYPSTHELKNMSGSEFFRAVEQAGEESTHASYRHSPLSSAGSHRGWRASKQRLVHFSEVPSRIRKFLEPQEWMYPHSDDAKARMQYMWLSTPGVRTHTHFDSDPNFFVQLIGRKRFVLWAPNQSATMCPFPRLHPLWHKSRADFEKPDLTVPSCERYNESIAVVVEVNPGDVLFVPQFWWHTVETLSPSPSLSLSTLSRWPQLYIHLNAIYSHNYFFDQLRSYSSRLYALRLFLVQLMKKAGGDVGGTAPIISAIRRQYAGFESLFERAPDDEQQLCVIDDRGTPTCRNCLARTSFDVMLVWDEHLTRLPADVRAIVLSEFIEEVTNSTVGISKTLPFWERCFEEQPFFLTQPGLSEHIELWQEGSADIEIDSD